MTFGEAQLERALVSHAMLVEEPSVPTQLQS
jgi:hypothetical protein